MLRVGKPAGGLKSLARWIHLMSVLMTVVLSLGALGADCSPSPPSCGAGIGPAGCPQGQHRVCLNRCVTYVGAGASCSLDPCTGSICAANLACVPSSAGSLSGTCQAAVSDLGCDPTSMTSRCFEGTFCQRRGTQSQVDAHTVCALKLSAQNGKAGLCVTPAREGEHCDGDWNAAMVGTGSLICSPCEPGMACVGGLCQRKCNVTSDCACSSGGGITCRAALPGSGTRVCDMCRGDGANCEGVGRANYACCNAGSGSSCAPTGTTFTCCRGTSKSCSIDVPGQCCSGLTCQGGSCQTCVALGSNATDVRVCCGVDRRIIGGTCAACRIGGQTASGPSECCSGLSFDAALGICKTGCTQTGTSACEVPGAIGACREGRVTDCDPMTGAPICSAVSGPTAEVCDGQDNDCDGMTDEGTVQGNSCTDNLVFETVDGNVAAACPSALGMIQGHIRCTRAGPRCVALRDYDYCVSCGPGGSGPMDPYGRLTMNCGACANTPCPPPNNSNFCAPNSVCAGVPPLCYARLDAPTCHNWSCWTSASLGNESCAP